MKTSTGNQEEDMQEHSDAEWHRLQKIADSAAAQLDEHFDMVQIVLTNHCPQTGTTRHSAGKGNVWGRVALTKSWTRDMKRGKLS